MNIEWVDRYAWLSYNHGYARNQLRVTLTCIQQGLQTSAEYSI